MKHARFSPSVNILRDETQDLNYIVTPNAERRSLEIETLITKGFRAFTVIGSYGSGKSAFLWALERNSKTGRYFSTSLGKGASFLKLVGEYASLRAVLANRIGSADFPKSIFAKLGGLSQKTPLFLVLDEFGKFLEYAVKNEPEREIYFLQQLAEFIADPANNCVLITTLHQNFDAYSSSRLSTAEKNEWRKVSGRFKEITFNEPVEQLLFLASKRINNTAIANPGIIELNLKLQDRYSILRVDGSFLRDVSYGLWPLDLFTAYLLAVGLQRYGQNERSLFTFLEGEFDETKAKHVLISDIYDYLRHEFYSHLDSDRNKDKNAWTSILRGVERSEVLKKCDPEIAQVVVKVIGLITLLGNKAAEIKREFLQEYLSTTYAAAEIEKAIDALEASKIILFTKYNNSCRIFEGTDVDFADALKKAEREIDGYIDLPSRLKEHFDFSVVSAKAVTYKLGTPRFFQYVISEKPIEATPTGQIDGFINLLFSEALSIETVVEVSKKQPETLYAKFQNVEDIRELLIDIERTTKAKAKHHEDLVARAEFDKILTSQKQLLNRNVLEALFTEQVFWIYNGEKKPISSSKELNKILSGICEHVYPHTPTFRNELVNRHILQGGNGAKNPYYKALVLNYHLEDLGFPKSKFPAEKTTYLTLLKETGIHRPGDSGYEFSPPDQHFTELWAACEAFLQETKSEKKKISALYDRLAVKPFKLTPGFLDFWIPTYLFIKRDDFALFSDEDAYQPEITEKHLYFFTRDASRYSVKAFDVAGIKFDLYNKYREMLHLKEEERISNKSLIESLKPFMVFHHHLNDYAKTTDRLTPEARALRQAIDNAEDPEKLFFEEFPQAVAVELKDLLASGDLFDDYIKKLRAAIRELQGCFDRLVDRIESFILEELLSGEKLEFLDYKAKIEHRFRHLKEHMLLPQQTALLIRLRSPLDDRTSWINSICHVLLGKSLDVIKDKEEEILKDKLYRAFKELDNLVVLTKSSNEGREKIIKIDITSVEEGTKEQVIRIPDSLDDEALDVMNKIKATLGKNKNLNKFILANLLKQQLND